MDRIKQCCLKIIDEPSSYICNECWYKKHKNEYKYNRYNQSNTVNSFTVMNDMIIRNMEDLIKYCLAYHYKIEIPKQYEVQQLYNIIFTVGDFDPEDRQSTVCRSYVVYTDTDYNKVKSRFNTMCRLSQKTPTLKSEKCFTWQTQDFAYNQIVHSYTISKSYKVTKITV